MPDIDLYGPASHRLLNINYQSGDETDPTTNDMPDAIWIGFLAAGLAVVGWGIWLRIWQKRYKRSLTAAAYGASSSAVGRGGPDVGVSGSARPGRGGAHRRTRPEPGRGQLDAVTIAERSRRWLAVIVTPVLAILPGLMLVQNSPTLLPRGHLLAAVAYLVIAAAVSIWGCSRGWRIALRLDDDGVTVRNYFRTYQFGWPEVRRFADGSVYGGADGSLWALDVVLHDGRVITASGTSRWNRAARPQTLAAIQQAAERYAIPAELTGIAMKRGPAQAPANPGHYPDPSGREGSRYWDGRQWSPFLQADPVNDGPEADRMPPEDWSPLPGQQWHNAAARARRAGIRFAVWLAATIVALTVTVALYAHDLSQPHADFTLALSALGLALLCMAFTLAARSTRKYQKKIDRANKAAAGLADTRDSTAVDGLPLDDRGQRRFS